jgi:hypothetical protein
VQYDGVLLTAVSGEYCNVKTDFLKEISSANAKLVDNIAMPLKWLETLFYIRKE